MSQHRQGDMAMPPGPAADLVLVQPDFALGFLDVGLDGQATAGHASARRASDLVLIPSAAVDELLHRVRRGIARQRRFVAIVESVERQNGTQRSHLAELDALFASLQHRAFRRDL